MWYIKVSDISTCKMARINKVSMVHETQKAEAFMASDLLIFTVTPNSFLCLMHQTDTSLLLNSTTPSQTLLIYSSCFFPTDDFLLSSKSLQERWSFHKSRYMQQNWCYMTKANRGNGLWYLPLIKTQKTYNYQNALHHTGPINAPAGGWCNASMAVFPQETKWLAGCKQSQITVKR